MSDEIVQLVALLGRTEGERDALRARIAELEKSLRELAARGCARGRVGCVGILKKSSWCGGCVARAALAKGETTTESED